mgnify:CR=1 FL=1
MKAYQFSILGLAAIIFTSTLLTAQCGYQFLGKKGDVIYNGWEGEPFSSTADSTIIYDSLEVLSDSVDSFGSMIWRTKSRNLYSTITQFADGLVAVDPGGVLLWACDESGVWHRGENKMVMQSLCVSNQRILRRVLPARGVAVGFGDTTQELFESVEVRYFVDRMGPSLFQDAHQGSDKYRVVGGVIMGIPIGFLPTSVDELHVPKWTKESYVGAWLSDVPDEFEGGTCDIYSIAGVLVRRIEIMGGRISVEGLSSGVYLQMMTTHNSSTPSKYSLVHFLE